MKDARATERVGDYVGAARMYAEVSISIRHNLPWVHSGSGRFYNASMQCLERMASCARAARADGDRRKILAYVLPEWALQTDGLSDHTYTRVLEEGIAGRGDVRFLLRLLDMGIPRIYDTGSSKASRYRHLRRMRGEISKLARGGNG